MYSLEDRIYQQVVMDRVYLDTNLVGGSEQHILLDGLQTRYTDHTIVIHIPASRLNGKRLLSALSVDLPYTDPGSGGLQAAMEGPKSTVSSAVRICGINTIELAENLALRYLFLRCRVGDEPNYQDWDARSIPTIGEMAVLAAKMIIYTKLNSKLGDGTTGAGTVNSYIRGELDSFQDAATLYREFRKTNLRKATIFKDPVSRKRALEATVPNLF